MSGIYLAFGFGICHYNFRYLPRLDSIPLDNSQLTGQEHLTGFRHLGI